MSARVALSALLLAVIAVPTLGPASDPGSGAASAQAGAWSLERGEYASEVRISSLTTSSLYDAEGNRYEFTDQYKLQHLGMSWRSELGWRKKLSLRLGLGGVSVVGFDGPPLAQPAASGLTEIQLGLHYKIANGAKAMAFEADWIAPAGYDRELSRAFGDGRQEFAGRLNAGAPVGSKGFFELSGGGSYRFHKLGSSDAAANQDPRLTTNLYYDFGADLGFWIGQSVLIGGRYRGRIMGSTTGEGAVSNVHSVGPMVLTGDSQIGESVHLAGPVLMYRVHERIDLLAGSYSTAAGKNTAHYDQFYVSLVFKQSKLKRNQGFLGGSAP
jgi:hypothetical protein